MERRPVKAAPQFLQVTGEQFAIPLSGRGEAGDLNRLTPLQWKVVAFVAYVTTFGGRTRLTNLEIGLGIGMDGDPKTIIRSIMNAISGRRSHGKRMPGIKEKGYFKVFMNADPRSSWQRELEVTAKWKEPKSIKLAEMGTEESIPVAAPAATAAVTAATLATEAELPTLEQRKEVFGRRTLTKTRPELAEWFIGELRGRGKLPELAEGAIRVRLLNPGTDPLSAAEDACLKWLHEEVIAELKPKAAPELAIETAPKPAPRVANTAQIRTLIGRLSAAPPGDYTDCEALAYSLVSEFKDKDPERSRQTYLGIARDAAQGVLPLNVLIEAFEEACKPQKKNRGAAFVHEVKRLKAHLKANEAKD
jgi:hypothetical protein